MEVILEFGNPLAKVVLEEILKFTGEFHTCWATADHNHVEETLDLFGGLIFEGGGFTAVHDTLTDLLSVTDFLQEAAVFTYTGDSKGSVLSSNTNNQHIKWNLVDGGGPLDVRVIGDVDNPLLVINLGGFRFVVFDRRLLVAEEIANGFHDTAVFDRSRGA